VSGVYDLAKASAPEEGQEAHEFTGAFVISVNGDGTVGLNYLGEEHPYVEALSSYMDRQIGDLVLVRSMGDHWTVIGRVGDAFQVYIPPQPTVPPAHGHPYTDITSPPPVVTWGLTDPVGTGWNVIVTGAAWGNNDGRLYFKSGGGTTPPTQPPPSPPPEPPPAPALVTTFTPTAVKAYAWNGTVLAANSTSKWPQGLNEGSDSPLSGYPPYASLGAGPWGTLWCWGTAVRDFLNAYKSRVAKIEMRFIRSSVTHGYAGSEQPQLWTLDASSPPSTVSEGEQYGVDYSNPWYGPGLLRGQEGWWQWSLPIMLDHFTTGQTSNSVMAFTPSTYDFCLFASGSGDLKVTLNP
jgi:hypothetical protein